MPNFEDAYQDAHESGFLPGLILMAKDRQGDFDYVKSIGTRSLKPGVSKPMELDTVFMLASCTKLMTAISALQCVERGLLSLDEDVTMVLPEVGKFGIITGFDDAQSRSITVPNKEPVTLRRLLSHTSGYQYDLMSPLLQKWRAGRGEVPYSGTTVVEKSTLPLVFEPGTSWAYGAGHDWAGKMIERVTGETLETYMSKNIWEILEMKDTTFWPGENMDMKERMADICMLDLAGSGKAIDAPEANINSDMTDCLGGGGVYGSPEAFMTLLHAVLNNDSRLLQAHSYDELFKPQLDERCKQSLHNLLLSDQQMQDYVGLNIPTSGQKNWSFAGILSTDEYPGWMRKNTLLWGGMPNIVWFIDREAGLCAFAGCQIMPPMIPQIMRLHEKFQHGIYDVLATAKLD